MSAALESGPVRGVRPLTTTRPAPAPSDRGRWLTPWLAAARKRTKNGPGTWVPGPFSLVAG